MDDDPDDEPDWLDEETRNVRLRIASRMLPQRVGGSLCVESPDDEEEDEEHAVCANCSAFVRVLNVLRSACGLSTSHTHRL